MSVAPASKRKRADRLVVIALVLTIVAVLVAANAHLVHVSFASQPDCVPHAKTAHEPNAGFRAARSSC